MGYLTYRGYGSPLHQTSIKVPYEGRSIFSIGPDNNDDDVDGFWPQQASVMMLISLSFGQWNLQLSPGGDSAEKEAALHKTVVKSLVVNILIFSILCLKNGPNSDCLG